jgi:hypothetical protein
MFCIVNVECQYHRAEQTRARFVLQTRGGVGIEGGVERAARAGSPRRGRHRGAIASDIVLTVSLKGPATQA